ncbi:MAG: hypothetical protein NC410_11520 [Oscillibacter sp.]|nr:hypothetical protein [Oscillibacter sp.]
MKRLKKITFSEIGKLDVLDNEKMMMIRGGATTEGVEIWSTSGGTCGLNVWKNGVRVKKIRGLTKEEALAQYEAFQHDADAHYFYDEVYWCCDSCD